MNVKQEFIKPNKYTRPGIQLQRVTAIAIHYTGDPGATAQNERDYFNGPCISAKRYASCHFCVGLNGEIIQLIPENEYAYCTCQANAYSLSIETCHPDSSGKFTEAGEKSLVELAAALCKKYGLNPASGLIRHYDVTRKVCPKYYVEHPACWTAFKTAVAACMAGKPYSLPSYGSAPATDSGYCDTAGTITLCPGMTYQFKTGSLIKCASSAFQQIAHSLIGGYHITKFKAVAVTPGAGFYVNGKRVCVGAVKMPWTDTPAQLTKKLGEIYQFKSNAPVVSGNDAIFAPVGSSVKQGEYYFTKFRAAGRGSCGFYIGSTRTNVGTVV